MDSGRFAEAIEAWRQLLDGSPNDANVYNTIGDLALKSKANAEAIDAYLDVNEWQVGGIKRAIASLDRGDVVSHERIKEWVASWGSKNELPIPKRSTR